MYRRCLNHLFCCLLLPAVAQSQALHWQMPNGDVYRNADFAPGGPDLFFERVAPPTEASNMATIIGQDSSGFIWIASRYNYILRFDGHHYQRFDTPVPMGNKFHVIDAATNSIWMGTLAGICCFDMANGDCQVYPNEVSAADSIMERLFFDPGRQVLVCNSGNGLYEFSLSEQRYTRRLGGTVRDGYTGVAMKDGVPIHVTDLKLAKDGSYWMTGYAKLYGLNLTHYQPETGEWQVYPQQFLQPTGQPTSHVDSWACYSLYLDPDDQRIWVGGNNGLKCFDPKTRRWQQYLLNRPEHVYASNIVYDIFPWGQHYLALTSHIGLHLFDPDLGRGTRQFHNYRFFKKSFSSNWAHIVHQPLLDRHGTLWFLTGVSGFFKLDPRKQFFNKAKDLGDDFSPNRVYRDTATQTSWLLGIDFTTVQRKGYRLHEQAGKVIGFAARFCQSSFVPEPGRGRVWVGTNDVSCEAGQGLWLLDLAKNSCSQPHLPVLGCPAGTTTDSLGNCHLSMAPDGNIWIASQRFGLLKYEAASGKCRRILPRHEADTLLPKANVALVLADSKGRVWYLPGGGQSVNCLDPVTFAVRTYPLPPEVEAGWATRDENFVETADGLIWATADGNLFRLDPRLPQGKFELVPGIRPVGSYITTDDHGNLWCNTKDGLATYQTVEKRWKTISVKDGLPESTGDESVSNCAADRMYYTGATWFQPSALRFNKAAATPVFTGLRVNETPHESARFLNMGKELRLLPGQNAITIEFAATAFTNPEDNAFAYRISGANDGWQDISTRRSATFTNLEPGHYRFELKAANSDGFWNEKPATLAIYIAPFFYQTIWFKMLVGALALCAAWFFYKNRLKAARREALLAQKDAELRQQQAEFQQQLAELENAALRSQMNPHFIFNVLNSIQYFLESNDSKSASDYLTKFSRLVRMVLDNSGQKSVTLHSDLTALLLYLEMEALRFGGKMTYSLVVAPEIDQKYVRVPPLLIQPYAENAIWHGLMHKKAGGTVAIRITQPDELLLRVEVEDDGIGRSAAIALKSKSATVNKSKGMDLTARRLALLGGTGGKQVEIIIHDLTDPEGQASGTRVVVEIPV